MSNLTKELEVRINELEDALRQILSSNSLEKIKLIAQNKIRESLDDYQDDDSYYGDVEELEF